jgi:inward rectifier potassium channel
MASPRTPATPPATPPSPAPFQPLPHSSPPGLTRPPAQRLLLRDGRYNIARVGVRPRYWRDLYHRLLRASWAWLIALLVGGYIGINALFACVYLALGDGIENARPGSFADAFFFSVQTMATIGYGKMVPSGMVANALVTCEALIGLTALAVATGLLFAKFSRPFARVTFSRNAVITTRDGKKLLMFRVANERDSLIVEAQMRLVLVRTEKTKEGESLRRFVDLPLERERTAIFPLSWSIIHPVDESSPFHGATVESMREAECEIIASMTGLEETFAQTIHARYSYTPDDIALDAKLADILVRMPDGRRGVDYTRFHDVVRSASDAR